MAVKDKHFVSPGMMGRQQVSEGGGVLMCLLISLYE
jgi:hypothetical protein